MATNKRKPKPEKLEINPRFKEFEQDMRKISRAKSQPVKTKQN